MHGNTLTRVAVALALGSGCHGARGTYAALGDGTANEAMAGSPLAFASASGTASVTAATGPSSASTDDAAPMPPSSGTSGASGTSATATTSAAPFGAPTVFGPYTCPVLQHGGPHRPFLAAGDTHIAFVDGDDLLALVNRSPTGALAPDYAPTDLVDLKDGKPRAASECGAQRECMRREAAEALHRMLDAMKAAGVEGHVQSAFRSFATQCWVFESWARQARGGFCEATAQSALPGHSQHQLGTTLDLFTKEWADEGARSGTGVFRNGFGCTRGGRWLDEQSWNFGFVVPYPIHPDDRRDGSRCEPRNDRPVPIDPKTGYKSEPWHLRFIGVDAAARFHRAWLASGPGSSDEITLEQWIRSMRGLPGDTELPVCDGCQCGACATLAEDDARAPCGNGSIWLDDVGRVSEPPEMPRIIDAHATRASSEGTPPRAARGNEGAQPVGPKERSAASSEAEAEGAVMVEAEVHAPPHTPTQPPVFGAEGPVYRAGASYLALVPYPGTQPHHYPDLPGTWRLAIDAIAAPTDADPPGRPPADGHARAMRWPWRASLASPDLEPTWNRADVVLPAKAGDVAIRVRIVVPKRTRALVLTLLQDGVEHGTREIPMP